MPTPVEQAQSMLDEFINSSLFQASVEKLSTQGLFLSKKINKENEQVINSQFNAFIEDEFEKLSEAFQEKLRLANIGARSGLHPRDDLDPLRKNREYGITGEPGQVPHPTREFDAGASPTPKTFSDRKPGEALLTAADRAEARNELKFQNKLKNILKPKMEQKLENRYVSTPTLRRT